MFIEEGSGKFAPRIRIYLPDSRHCLLLPLPGTVDLARILSENWNLYITNLETLAFLTGLEQDALLGSKCPLRGFGPAVATQCASR